MKYRCLLFSLLCVFSQCNSDELSRGFSIYNNSGSPICYFMPWEHGVFYPDTALIEIDPKPYKMFSEYHFSFADGRLNENSFFDNFPTDTISIFFFDPVTLEEYDWLAIKNEYKILARYDLSHSDLRKLNWEICYPPSEGMKHIKMFPLYNSFHLQNNVFYTVKSSHIIKQKL